MSGSLESLWRGATRFLFFTGKGGVGKTSLACATGVALADAGRRVLLVSTDPASNLDEVLQTRLTSEPLAVTDAPGLFAQNIDPEAAAAAYREKLVGPMRGILPDAALRSMEEQLSGACTMEIAAFDEFARLLGDASATADFDHVIFDTAPTGHTLRLLTLPKAWAGFFQENKSGTSCLGPLSGLAGQRALYEGALAALSDAGRTTLILVSRSQKAALREAERSSRELAALGIKNQHLVLNGVFASTDRSDPVGLALERKGLEAQAECQTWIDSLPTVEVALRAQNLLGFEALRAVFQSCPPPRRETRSELPAPVFEPVDGLIRDLTASGRGVILTMGKGGVGKTTIAAALAVRLARSGAAVHLSTTDPAAHLMEALAGDVCGLTVSRIDPAVETLAYTKEVLETQGASLDPESLALLEEDLRSPCTEEIAVFRAFARTVAQAQDSFVILDTAPTGHTLLLLDAAEAYHRELGRQTREGIPEEVRHLIRRLRDPDYTKVLVVTLPEATPVHEAAALQSDLRRAGIEPFAWVVNQSFSLLATGDALLRERAANEIPFQREVRDSLAKRSTLLPWLIEEPVGAEALLGIFKNPNQPMPTYIYETTACCGETRYFEIEHAADDAPLEKHPETGESIRQVMVGSEPLQKREESSSCCDGGGCC